MQREGLFGKYLIRKTDGTPLAPEARYFVVRYDAAAAHGAAGRTALKVYCSGIRFAMPELAESLRAELDAEARKSAAPQEDAAP